MFSADCLNLISSIETADTVEARWLHLTAYINDNFAGLAANYALFGTVASTAQLFLPLSTMPTAWLDRYERHRYDLVDPLAIHAKSGTLRPMAVEFEEVNRLLGDCDLSRRFRDDVHSTEPRWRFGCILPLRWQVGGQVALASFSFGLKVGQQEFNRMFAHSGPSLMAGIYTFHQANLSSLMQYDASYEPQLAGLLSSREKDCLTFAASGMRAKEVAHRLSISKPTVDMHLASARRKLSAATLSQSVAKAILGGHIHL